MAPVELPMSVLWQEGAADHHESDGQHSEEEAPDVREEGNAPAGLGLHDREAALPELEQEPEAEEEDRRQLLEEDEDEEDRGQDARIRQQDEIGPEHRGDRAARPDVRDAR